MTIGKPRPPITPEQKRAFDAKLKKDASELGIAAVMGLGRFITENPENTISQVAQQPFVKGLMVIAAETVIAERAKAEKEAAEAKKATVVDAEFVDDDEKPKTP